VAPEEGPYLAVQVEQLGLYGDCHDRLPIQRIATQTRALATQGKSDGGQLSLRSDGHGFLGFGLNFLATAASVRQ
jgi:hypothetical protein